MNPDDFHRLCDHYLFFEGEDEFDGIVPVGQVEGKQKARKGTPDTHIMRSINRMKTIFKATGTKAQEHFAELLEIFEKENKRFDHFAKTRWDECGVRLISGEAKLAEINERSLQRVKAVLEKIQHSADYLEHRVFVGKQIAYCQRSAIREGKHNFLRKIIKP
ncbi:hypothetical protein [Mucilaginibacter pocheonensis]|uniref:Uncharacterized protein n=1 Tax=Mucilaginibacter pocheonensis TaxID=398050 RepID=A0ABU1TE98_9SPHI|nr:hypothetical protein [Mucilaginibacter pocheonensis]MDR6943702.1 hypothetical protein [Mucilaginibacter pocheonensis]